jgi:hypothetical protein
MPIAGGTGERTLIDCGNTKGAGLCLDLGLDLNSYSSLERANSTGDCGGSVEVEEEEDFRDSSVPVSDGSIGSEEVISIIFRFALALG